ncbi:SPFH domain-containing protein [Thermoflexus sp.]|uniref:SPFH domain-containing protein n=1 Tax=Thermoflexus sp. TaxID=1969742 RepID=UPI0025DD18EA|nr:SPFH domain-containing protein [Thermoflexus sp.]MDW8179418.1 SPFH domain-containing protein [Anaerolineae bacterium]MCS6964485.1 SPFH/Band 7/PHB domain protein [Thermoflexus sp.]MCS7349970.1 SPFH/Band 7/PHB domain protein [Thermoflexus sp.]MCX7690180.1 SPFH/Band 7/PHB domain protein [Thermoflexus sp.]MDW8183744.1 SPFH domain-containing protein [Anaerolineae bacterium]
MENFVSLLLLLVCGALILFALLGSMIRIVPEYQRLVVFRLGKVIGAKGPGLVILIPVVDRAITVDLREQFREIPQQTSITKDNAPIGIDFLIYWRVVDPIQSVVQVRDFVSAAVGIATTTLRAVIGDILLDDVLAKREYINQALRVKLDEVTERWGVKVTAVEIREIQPPRDVLEAMTRQMSAERNRRALVTEADGKREAAVKVAEGEKQAAILKAEGEKEAAILRAEGERQAQILRAEGFSMALERIFSVARTLDANTMTLQYLEALKALGASPATKFVFPMEFTRLVAPLSNLVGDAGSRGSSEGSEPSR